MLRTGMVREKAPSVEHAQPLLVRAEGPHVAGELLCVQRKSEHNGTTCPLRAEADPCDHPKSCSMTAGARPRAMAISVAMYTIAVADACAVL